jgi:hypothetical protein
MKKLIIHPGFHKTGTTSLQQALASSRESLMKEGFYYPKIGGGAQHRAAWAVIEKTWGWKKRLGNQKIQFFLVLSFSLKPLKSN